MGILPWSPPKMGALSGKYTRANGEKMQQTEAPNAVSKPTLNLPADFHRDLSPNFQHAGATVDGVHSKLLPNVPLTTRNAGSRALLCELCCFSFSNFAHACARWSSHP